MPTATKGRVQNQTEIDEALIENDELLLALEKREECKESVASHRKATKIIQDIVGEMDEYSGKLIRVGRFLFEIFDDPGGDERQGYITAGGIKAKKIRTADGEE